MSDPKATPPAAQEAETKRAFEHKAAAPAVPHPSPGKTSDAGMKSTPNAEIAPSGAFGAEGQRPVLERSRKVR